MPSPKYDTEVDLSNSNTSHTLMVELVGGNKNVLDVGCSTGYLARALAGNGCVVSGFEVDAEAAAEAAPDLAKLVVGDLETTDLSEAFGAGAFDVVVFGDVLEHLRDPLAALRQSRALLAPGGSVVASIPNVAHGSMRLSLLAGRFDYQPLGLLDETHLRFFTRRSMEAMLRDAGMVPVDLRRTTTGVFEAHVKVDPDEVSQEILDAVLAEPEALTYQFVVRAIVDDADSAVWELHNRAEAQHERIARLERDVAHAEADREDAEAKAAELGARAEQLERRIEDLEATLHGTRSELARLLDTRTMRYIGPLRTAYGRTRRLLGR